MIWILSGLVAGAGLASLIFWYYYWRRLTESDYRLPATSSTGLILAGTWAVWTTAVHHPRGWMALLVAIIVGHIVTFIVYGVGSSP